MATSVSRGEQMKRLAFSVDIKDLKSYKCHEPTRKDSSTWVRLMSKDGTNYVPLYFREGGLVEFVEALQRYCTLKRSAKEQNLVLFVDEASEALQQSVSLLLNEHQPDFLSKLVSNPYATALSGLGRVSNFVQGQLIPALVEFDTLNPAEQQACADRLVQEWQDDTQAISDGTDSGFELVVRLELPERPRVVREAPLSREQWQSFVAEDGSVRNVRQLKLLVFRGGVAPDVRADVWKFLLGAYGWSSTAAERRESRKRCVDDYFRMKLQWKSMSDAQEARFADFRDRKALVDKDVTRTDRTQRFFEGDNNANVSALNDILLTYCMYDFDLGYVQGMSDFLAPILFVLENEVDAFWAFVGLMDRMHKNFELDQKSIRNQLMQLRDLLIVICPKLFNYLESHNSDNMFFTFRWLLVLFKREFSFTNTMRLWEVLWTGVPCRNFHLLVCVAILDSQADTVIENGYGFHEILKHVNDLSSHIPLEETLIVAEGIYHQLAATQDKLPTHICDILGFSPYGLSSNSPERESAARVTSPAAAAAPHSTVDSVSDLHLLQTLP